MKILREILVRNFVELFGLPWSVISLRFSKIKAFSKEKQLEVQLKNEVANLKICVTGRFRLFLKIDLD